MLGPKNKNLIARLQIEQKKSSYISDLAIKRISKELAIPIARIYGVLSFYSQFRRRPLGRHIIKLCRGTACHVAGSLDLLEELKKYLRIPEGGDTSKDGRFTIEEVACIGCCSLAPAVVIDEDTHGKLDIDKLKSVLDNYG